VLLVDMSERERHGLQEQLRAAGFEVMIALNHADVRRTLPTWRPDGIIADCDLASLELAELVNIIRTSAPVPPSVVLLRSSIPFQDALAIVLLKPVVFADLLSALRKGLADRDDALMAGGWITPIDD
jgi:CheY-like chemotaxis protein